MSTSFFIGEGNLGGVPELKSVPTAQGNVSKLECSVRINVDRKNQTSGQFEDALGFWVVVEYWGKPAEVIAPLLQKGSRVVIVGELGMDSWISNQPATQGQERTTPKLKADIMAISPWGIEQVIYRAKAPAAQPTNQAAPQQAAVQPQPAQPVASPQASQPVTQVQPNSSSPQVTDTVGPGDFN